MNIHLFYRTVTDDSVVNVISTRSLRNLSSKFGRNEDCPSLESSRCVSIRPILCNVHQLHNRPTVLVIPGPVVCGFRQQPIPLGARLLPPSPLGRRWLGILKMGTSCLHRHTAVKIPNQKLPGFCRNVWQPRRMSNLLPYLHLPLLKLLAILPLFPLIHHLRQIMNQHGHQSPIPILRLIPKWPRSGRNHSWMKLNVLALHGVSSRSLKK